MQRSRFTAMLRWALAAAVCLLACNAPFIPVPPPANTFVAESLTDGTGVLVERANADGSYTAPPFEGASGDRVFISYVTPAGSESETVCRQLVEGDPAPTCSP